MKRYLLKLNKELYYYCWDVIFNAGYYVRTVVNDVKDEVMYYRKEDGPQFSHFSSLYDLYMNCRPKPLNKKAYNDGYDYNVYLDYRYGSGEWEVLGDYISNRTPIMVKHKCGAVSLITPNSLNNKSRVQSQCSKCASKSNGEHLVAEILKELNIDFTRQYSFKECKDQRPLPFDFGIFNLRETIPISCIEYDGIQHTEIVDRFGEESYFSTMHHDAIKNCFCEHHNIPLLRIPHTYKTYSSIKEIVKEFLSNPMKFKTSH